MAAAVVRTDLDPQLRHLGMHGVNQILRANAGGRHRSVMVAEYLAKALGSAENVQLRVRHRDVEQPV